MLYKQIEGSLNRQTHILILLILGKIRDYASFGREGGFFQRKRGIKTIQDGVLTAHGPEPKYTKVTIMVPTVKAKGMIFFAFKTFPAGVVPASTPINPQNASEADKLIALNAP